MLTKAVLTGVVLSALTGAIVYFGTEGADAYINETRNQAPEEQAELAGAPGDIVASTEMVASNETVEQFAKAENFAKMEKSVEVEDPPSKATKPKTKWLDQYLKRVKPKGDTASEEVIEADSEPMKDIEVEDAVEVESEPMIEVENAAEVEAEVMTEVEDVAEVEAEAMSEVEVEIEVQPDVEAQPAVEMDTEMDVDMEMSADAKKKRKKVRIKKRMKGMEADSTATGSYTVSEESQSATQDDPTVDLDAFDFEGEISSEALKEHLGIDDETDVDIRIVKKMARKAKDKPRMNKRPTIAYEVVLAEANKLVVPDMRNQAILEIIDYAIDKRDMSEAADLVDELSTPELRDTARARIGAGLARCGKADAAFAVINALEIEELAAPIRLEIITALMATKQERNAYRQRR